MPRPHRRRRDRTPDAVAVLAVWLAKSRHDRPALVPEAVHHSSILRVEMSDLKRNDDKLDFGKKFRWHFSVVEYLFKFLS